MLDRCLDQCDLVVQVVCCALLLPIIIMMQRRYLGFNKLLGVETTSIVASYPMNRCFLLVAVEK